MVENLNLLNVPFDGFSPHSPRLLPVISESFQGRAADTTDLGQPDFGGMDARPNHHADEKQSMNMSAIVIPAMSSEKVTLRKFSGYSHEDGDKFLKEFDSYTTFSGLYLDPTPARKIAAFHIHLSGPALVWFYSLTAEAKLSWDTLECVFRQKYIIKDRLDPTIMTESTLFHKIKLLPNQLLEDYHSLILGKGNKLGKPERDMLYQFIDGLPPSLAFFVRAGMCSTLDSALSSAQAGEAAGYRTNFPFAPAQTIPPPTPMVNAVPRTTPTAKSEIAELREQVSRLAELVQSSHINPNPVNSAPSQFVLFV